MFFFLMRVVFKVQVVRRALKQGIHIGSVVREFPGKRELLTGVKYLGIIREFRTNSAGIFDCYAL